MKPINVTQHRGILPQHTDIFRFLTHLFQLAHVPLKIVDIAKKVNNKIKMRA